MPERLPKIQLNEANISFGIQFTEIFDCILSLGATAAGEIDLCIARKQGLECVESK
jgi:hypothetical protein